MAGSLVAQGRFTWATALLVATLATVLGDLVGYEIGRLVGCELLNRHGKWVGLSRDRLAQTERFFGRWGALGLLLSRTLLSGLSSAVNLLAGAMRYRLRAFILWDVGGRLVWSAAYLGIGYGFGRSAELIAELLENGWMLLASLAVAGVAAYALYHLRRGAPPDLEDHDEG